MKLEFYVPDCVPVTFNRPSIAMLRFINDLIQFCLTISAYKTVGGQGIFEAYVRNGTFTVFSTSSGKTHFVECWYGSDYDDVSLPILETGEADQENDNHFVYMDEDMPGKWVVARLCNAFAKRPYVTLYSTDFEGQNPRVIGILAKCIANVVTHRHTVPTIPDTLKQVFEILRAP